MENLRLHTLYLPGPREGVGLLAGQRQEWSSWGMVVMLLYPPLLVRFCSMTPCFRGSEVLSFCQDSPSWQIGPRPCPQLPDL